MTPLRVHDRRACIINLPETWQVLGPFQIGTREAAWGSDPLEYLGGFRSLEYDEKDMYHSTLGLNGSVSWSSQSSGPLGASLKSAKATVTFAFPNVDWNRLRSVYGWAALQYQGWARGEFTIAADEPQIVVWHIDQILEFFIDGQHYFGGDFYAYRRAPLVLRLIPGRHRIDLRLIREVRAMGGVGDPKISIDIEAKVSDGGLAVQGTPLLPDVVEGKLVSSLGSFIVRNDEQEWIDVLSLELMTVGIILLCQDARIILMNFDMLITAGGHPRYFRPQSKGVPAFKPCSRTDPSIGI